MPTATKKKTTTSSKKKMAEDPLSSSGVSSLSGTLSSYNIRKISIFKNGDRFHRGVKFVINPRIVKDMEPLLNQINDRIELSHGAKKLYTTDGKVVTSVKELEDGKIYVAASAQFIPMRYGEFTEKVWKPPSRKHSPIMSADRIKTARTRSQEPGKRRQPQAQNATESSAGVQRSRSVRTLNEDRKSRRDTSRRVNGVSVSKSPASRPTARPAPPPAPKKETPILTRPKAPAPKSVAKVPPTKKPPTPKRAGVSKKVVGAAAGAGIAVVGAAALGAAAAVGAGKKKPGSAAVSRPIPTGVSTASSVMPVPNVESNAAEILEFPEEERKVDVATIHQTPTPPKSAAPGGSRSASAKSTKSLKKPATADRSAKILEAKSISQQPTPESSEESEGEDEDVEEDDEEEEEEDGSEAKGEPSEEGEGDEEEEENEDEGEEEEEEEEEGGSSGVETPASRRSSSAVSSAGSKADDEEHKK